MSSTSNNFAVLSLLIVVIMVGCVRSREQREWQYMPDMAESPAVKAQEADMQGNSLMRLLPDGVIPVDKVPYQVAQADTLEAMALVNPLPLSEPILEVGRKYFEIYCTICHGPSGAGDGPIIPKMPPPPPLYSEKVNGWSDGRIFHVISWGQGNMPSYSSSIDQTTRWAIIHYLRVIQRSQAPTVEDLNIYDKLQPEK